MLVHADMVCMPKLALILGSLVIGNPAAGVFHIELLRGPSAGGFTETLACVMLESQIRCCVHNSQLGGISDQISMHTCMPKLGLQGFKCMGQLP